MFGRGLFTYLIVILSSFSVTTQVRADQCNAIISVGKNKILSKATLVDARFTLDSKKTVAIVAPATAATHASLLITEVGAQAGKTIDPFARASYPGVTVQLSTDAAFALFTPPAKYQSTPVLYDVQNKKFIHLKLFAHAKAAKILRDSNTIIAKLSDNSLGVYFIDSGESNTLQVYQSSWTFAETKKSNVILIRSKNGYSREIDLKVASATKTQAPRNSYHTTQNAAQNVAPANKTVSPDGSKVLTFYADTSRLSGGTYVLQDLTEISVDLKAAHISNTNVEQYYSVLAKPGALSLHKNAGEVFSFFESGQFRLHQDLAQKLLLNVLSESIGMYEALIARYPEFASDHYYFKEEMNLKIAPRWKKAIVDYLDYFVLMHGNAKDIVDALKFIRPLHNYFRPLSVAQLDTYSGDLTESLADAADLEFTGIFKSMIYKFCEEYINPMFWIPLHPVTDITTIKTPFQIEPVILGTAPISGDRSTKTSFGFYAKRLPVIDIPKDAKAGDVIVKNSIIPWTQDEHQLEARMDLQVIDKSIDPVIPPIKKFNYKRLWKDKKLTGMVVVGSNLVAEDKSTIEGYEEYFKQMGFKFEVQNTYTKDLKSYFSDKIASGEVDYFIKEAHSDGDERNLFRINTRAKIVKAWAMRENGYQEVVYLVIPTKSYVDQYDDPANTVEITNDEFGKMIEAREKAKQPPLVYLNASCWSVSKMINEIESAYSKDLIEIPSTMPVDMFENKPSNAEYGFLTGFRAGETMSRIRMRMRMNPDYVHATGNTFLLPDDPEIKTLVNDVLKPPVKINVILTKDGKAYSIDE